MDFKSVVKPLNLVKHDSIDLRERCIELLKQIDQYEICFHHPNGNEMCENQHYTQFNLYELLLHDPDASADLTAEDSALLEGTIIDPPPAPSTSDWELVLQPHLGSLSASSQRQRIGAEAQQQAEPALRQQLKRAPQQQDQPAIQEEVVWELNFSKGYKLTDSKIFFFAGSLWRLSFRVSTAKSDAYDITFSNAERTQTDSSLCCEYRVYSSDGQLYAKSQSHAYGFTSGCMKEYTLSGFLSQRDVSAVLTRTKTVRISAILSADVSDSGGLVAHT